MVEGGLWWEVGVERLAEKAEQATQINREHVNWQASGTREQGFVKERVCLRERH